MRPRHAMDAGSSEWHGEAMLDKGIRTRYGGLPLMLSRQNPCGEPATSPLLPAFCRAFGLRTRILTESPPPPAPPPVPAVPSRHIWAPSRSGRHARATMRYWRTRFAGQGPICTAYQETRLGRRSHGRFETPMTGAPPSWWDEVAWNARWQALSLRSAAHILVVVNMMRPWKRY